MRNGRPIPLLTLTREEQETWQRWVRRPKSAPALAFRSRIVLACAMGKAIKAVAVEWSTRWMAQRCGMSQSAVRRIGRAFALQPHRSETFPLSPDPWFLEKVRDIVGLYLHPPDRTWVLCGDEKSPRQALDRSQPVRPGPIERRTHEEERHGTTSLLAALELVSGGVIGEGHRRHRTLEFRKFLDTVDTVVPDPLDVPMILDHSGTPQAPWIRRWWVRHPRYHLHFTPTGASGRNLVERWFATGTERPLRRGVHRSTPE